MTCATVGAMSWSSFFPWRIDESSFAYTSRGSFARICLTPNALTPRSPDVGGCVDGALPFVRAESGAGRAVMSLRSALRVVVDGRRKPELAGGEWPSSDGSGRRRLHRELCSACTNYTAFVQFASLNEPGATVIVQIMRIFADMARVQLGRFDAQRT